MIEKRILSVPFEFQMFSWIDLRWDNGPCRGVIFQLEKFKFFKDVVVIKLLGRMHLIFASYLASTLNSFVV